MRMENTQSERARDGAGAALSLGDAPRIVHA